MAINREYSVTINNSVSEININVISVTEDRLENVLSSHFSRLNKSKDWIGAVALTLTLLIVLVTSQFKDILLDAPTWKALFIFLFLASALYSIYTIANAIRYRDSVKNIIRDLKSPSSDRID